MDSGNTSGKSTMQMQSSDAFFNNQPPPQSHVDDPFTTNNNLPTNSHTFPPQQHHMSTFHPLSNYMMNPIQTSISLPIQNQAFLFPGQTSTAATTTTRNPKKRSRASRREPTTVLTTDTTNFRAMVQEFTGIPSPPPFTTRFDLFSTTSTTVRSTTSPTVLLRPFAQKLLPHPNFRPDSSNNLTNSTASINYQLPSDEFLGLLKLQMQNPDQNHSLGNSSTLEIPPSAADSSHLRMGVFQELGLRHEDHDGVASTEWAQRNIASGTTITNNDCDIAATKLHHPDSNSIDFHGQKGAAPPECSTVSARSQGMVETWINSSSGNN